ncbi:MAG: LysM peptidoglycan-binding domain-containing protein [Lachnospiraceae bacterium]|nr:LysM peptidoglycan-binding domain-containing protein [Lachnospiraceae bacterium]
MENNRFGNLGEYAKESAHKEYVYSHLPENIRQIGETNGGLKIYIEDYVMTYIHQIFTEKQEKAIVVFLGKKGREQASGCVFLYGAIQVQCDIMEGPKGLTANKWNQVYEEMNECFPGAQILGWGCGVSMWNSRADVSVKQIHGKFFSENGKMLYVTDMSEKEEKIFVWNSGGLSEQPGFVVYYEKNPQMQEYMLRGKGKRSIEAAYKDDVTENMRTVIKEKEDVKVIKTKHIGYATIAAMFIMLVAVGGLLHKSMDKIKYLEETVAAVEGYIGSNMVQAVMTDGSSIKEEGGGKAKNKKAGGQDKNNSSNKSEDNSDISPEKGNINTDSKDTNNKITDNTGDSVTAAPSRQPASKDKNTSSKSNNSNNKKTASKTNGGDNSGNAKKASTYNGKYDSYIVNAGDTLSQIVWKQYHSFYYLDKVMKANNIKNSDKIYEGDCIILPDFNN